MGSVAEIKRWGERVVWIVERRQNWVTTLIMDINISKNNINIM